MLVLNANEALKITLGGANSHDYDASFLTIPSGGRLAEGLPEGNAGNVATTSQTTVVSAPASGSRRVITRLSVRNKTANSTTVLVVKTVSSTDYAVAATITLASGQAVIFGDDGKPVVYNATGEKKADA